MNCPLCSKKVLYQGLNRLECAGADCPNGKPRIWPKVGDKVGLYVVIHCDPVLDIIVLDYYGYPSFTNCEGFHRDYCKD